MYLVGTDICRDSIAAVNNKTRLLRSDGEFGLKVVMPTLALDFTRTVYYYPGRE